jgi:hypothetical protein
MLLTRDKPVSIGVLAPSLGMDRTTQTAYLKPLERRLLVRRIHVFGYRLVQGSKIVDAPFYVQPAQVPLVFMWVASPVLMTIAAWM